MKHRFLICSLLTLVLCLLLTASAEELPAYSFFSDISYRQFTCTAADSSVTVDAAFCPDGSYYGVADRKAPIYGYYAILPSGEMMLAADGHTYLLTAGKNSSFAGSLIDGEGSCKLTKLKKQTFNSTAKKADLWVDPEVPRMDASLYDYPVYYTVAAPGGVDLLLNPAWPDVVIGHLPQGTLMLMLGEERFDPSTALIEANGVRGFTAWDEDAFESVPVMVANVVRSSSNDKGRTVNIRKTPDYGKNVIHEVPYGEQVDVFPVTEGEFTRVYYDHCAGWMTTVRLEIVGTK